MQGVTPHNHRGGGKLTGIIARCCPSFPKIASISRERPRSPPEWPRRQLVRHGGSSRERENEKKRGRGKEEASLVGRERSAHTWPKRNDGWISTAERTCWNKGLANRRRWKLKRTHRRTRVYKNAHAQVAENIITVPFLGVSISVAGWRRARPRFLKTISFTGSGMCPSISSFWIPRRSRKGFISEIEAGEGETRSIPETS